MIASEIGRKNVVQLLLDNSERNIDLNAKTSGGWTAFIFASKTKEIDISTGQEYIY